MEKGINTVLITQLGTENCIKVDTKPTFIMLKERLIHLSDQVKNKIKKSKRKEDI